MVAKIFILLYLINYNPFYYETFKNSKISKFNQDKIENDNIFDFILF